MVMDQPRPGGLPFASGDLTPGRVALTPKLQAAIWLVWGNLKRVDADGLVETKFVWVWHRRVGWGDGETSINSAGGSCSDGYLVVPFSSHALALLVGG